MSCACFTNPETAVNATISEQLQCEYNHDRCVKNLLVIGPNACSTFFQIQKHFNDGYGEFNNDHENNLNGKKIESLIYGFIHEAAQLLLESQMIPYEINHLIRGYYPSKTCLLSNSSIVEHRYMLDRCHWRVLHVHDMDANFLFLNKIVDYYQSFENVSMIVFCVSLLICEDKEQLCQALDIFDYLINTHVHQYTCMSLLFEDVEEFTSKTTSGEIIISDLLDNAPGNNIHSSLDFITKMFVSRNNAPRQKQIFVHCITKDFATTWYDMRGIVIGVSLARGGLL